MGMREQAIEEVGRYLNRDPDVIKVYIRDEITRCVYVRDIVDATERALTAEVALAEARELIQKAIDHVDEWSGTDNFIERMVAWLELHKEKGTR